MMQLKDVMKKKIALVVLLSGLAVSLVFVVRSLDSTPVAFPKAAALQPCGAEVEKAYKSAMEAVNWIRFGGMAAGGEYQEMKNTGVRYYKAAHPTIKTVAELNAHYQSLFSEAMFNDLSANDYSGRFIEIDGHLYIGDMAIGANILKGEESYKIIRENNEKIIFRVTVEDLAEYEGEVIGHTTHDMIYEYIDGKWVFSFFELVR